MVRTIHVIAPVIRYEWPPKTGWINQLLGKSTSQQELLRQNPDYAWLFIFHPDGRLRELALDALDNPPTSPFFFAALAWRIERLGAAGAAGGGTLRRADTAPHPRRRRGRSRIVSA